MSAEGDIARAIEAIERRLDQLESTSTILYAKGTYTPTYTGNTTAGVTTYTLQVGAYVRAGKLVVATGIVGWSAATGTGSAVILLPFAAANVTDQDYSGSCDLVSVTFANSTPTVELIYNTTRFTMRSPLTNAAGTTVQVEAAGQVIFTVSYFV